MQFPILTMSGEQMTLTDEHPASSYGVPVLVTADGTAYGPDDHLPRGPHAWRVVDASRIVADIPHDGSAESGNALAAVYNERQAFRDKFRAASMDARRYDLIG